MKRVRTLDEPLKQKGVKMFKKFFIRRGLKLLKRFLGSRYLKDMFIREAMKRVPDFKGIDEKKLLHDLYDVVIEVLEAIVEKEFRG